MSAKKKKQSNSSLRVIIILVLLGLLAYKHQLFDGKLLENIPTIESNEEKPEILTSPQHGGALEIPTMQSGTGGQILKRKGYTLSYNADYKTPQWVAWELTKKETKGKEGRTDKFLPDPDVRGAKAYTGDYTKSGYDRGHMAPAADMKWSKKAMEESFYMSNICPQNQKLNRDDWGDLEELCRSWARKYGTVYIACGPIYDKKQPKRIGEHRVAVPDRFFKVVLIYNRKNPIAMGFLFDNKAHHQALEKYMVSVDSVEKVMRMDFFSKLPDDVENRIEADIPALPSGR